MRSTRDGRYRLTPFQSRPQLHRRFFGGLLKTGKLTSIVNAVTCGPAPYRAPLHLGPDSQWMVVAGQRSHDLHVYKRDSTMRQAECVGLRWQQPTGLDWAVVGATLRNRQKNPQVNGSKTAEELQKVCWQLNQPTPPLERRRVVVPDRAQSRGQAANVVFFRLGFLQVHHMYDGVEHFVQERVLH